MERSKNVFVSRLATALANALRSPKILEALAQHGIDELQIKRMQTQVGDIKHLDHQYHDATAEGKVATQALHAVREQAQQLYSRHVLLSRVALEDQPGLQEKMQLNGPRKKRWGEWMSQASNFYRHAVSVKETLASFNIPTKELSEMQKLLDRITELQDLQIQLKGHVQVVSEQRKVAYATLKKSISRFFQIAKIALDEEPQQLEALGLVVKA